MQEPFPIQHAWLIPLLPLIGAGVAGLFGAKVLKQQSHWPIWIGVGASAVLSIWMLVGMVGVWHGGASETIGVNKPWFEWITAGGFSAQAGAWIDPLTVVMLCVVTGIGFLITVFAKGYMQGEAGYFRFFAYLGLFIFMMSCLVMGNNLVMLYLGWEGVGLCSYLLIGYYYERPAAREAAKKAFLVNRVGDFGFGLGIMLCFAAFGTITYFSGTAQHTGLLELAQQPRSGGGGLISQITALKWIPFLLMLGAFGKSAQFPLYVWLPDAMEGPTPVSALIHAATMVTAGVYMIVRCGTLFVTNAPAMWTIAAVGCFTAIFAASIALRQFDLKKILAYSTISQLGFMFVAVGVLAPVAGVFHLVTHAFFKALLFLGAGVVMHAMGGELDLRKLSGLKRVLPLTRWVMLIGCAALAGVPLLSGFFSKDEIVTAAWARSPVLGAALLVTAFITAYYTFRLYFRVFEGPEVIPAGPATAHGAEHEAHEEAAASHEAVATGTAAQSGVDVAAAMHPPAHEAAHDTHEPKSMMVPLLILAVGAIAAGWLNVPERVASLGGFLGRSPSLEYAYNRAPHGPATIVNPLPFGQLGEAEVLKKTDPDFFKGFEDLGWSLMFVSGLVAIAGFYLAFLLHLKYRGKADELAARFAGISRVLEAKFWVDEVYQNGIVEPLRATGTLLFAVDRFIIDGIIWAISFVPQAAGFVLKVTAQRGYLQGYAVTMVFGIVVILVVVFCR